MKDAKIQKVMTSNLLYTLFFADGTFLELYRSQFRGTIRPKAGDMFRIQKEPQANGKTVSKFFLNGKEVKSQVL